jgi:alpha-D-xyloside xylohydrolase
MGFSGLLWTPEVRRGSSLEDLVRRVQTVIFSPQVSINAWGTPHPPWLQYDYAKNHAGELLENMEEVRDICKRLFELRMSFIPYLYSAFAKYCFEGISPFRALVMDYPSDNNVYNIDDEYMMGDNVLVAPVTAGKSMKKVYLPEGDWYCFWTDRKYKGGTWYELDVPLDRIPVYIKNGTLLPLAKPVEYLTSDTRFDITVMCYGEEYNDFVLFEDDGVSYDYKKGKYNYVILTQLKGREFRVVRTSKHCEERYRIIEWKKIK